MSSVDFSLGQISSVENLFQFLEWVDACPRTYAETMDAWRTSCPRLSIWEDALDNGLVAVEGAPGTARADKRVMLTGRGSAVLDAGRIALIADYASAPPRARRAG